MHIEQKHFSINTRISQTAAALLVFSLMICNTQVLQADFLAVGDVSSSLGVGSAAVDEAGGTADALIIGDTGTGGLLADGVAPLFGTLMPLESDNAIIGNQSGSIGAANIEDFIPGGNWNITGDLVVGHAGQGFLDFLNAAGIGDSPSATVGGTTFVGGGTTSSAPVVGDPRLGLGIIRVNGLGSRLLTQELIVGGDGIGVVEASGRSLIDTADIVEIGSTATIAGAFGDGTITLADLGTSWTARAPVTVGGLVGASHGKIVISDQAVMQVDGVTASPTPGTLTINPRGQVELANGTIRMLPQGTNFIINNGIILGDGFIDGGITIGLTGELRNAAATASLREKILVAELVTVAGDGAGLGSTGGLIESIGGEMEFENQVTNAGLIVARDAIMRFRGRELAGSVDDLLLTGELVMGGNTTIYGNITAPGNITVLAPSTATVAGDVIFTQTASSAALLSAGAAAMTSPTSSLSVTVGDTQGFLTVLGDLELAIDTILDLDFAASESSQPGDSFQILSADNIVGTFANTQAIADGRFWDLNYVGDEVFVTATGTLVSSVLGDFDADNDVDGLDFLTWQSGFGGAYDANDLVDWGSGFGAPAAPVASAAIGVVPEPSSLVLLLLGGVMYAGRRSRQAS